jgi:adenylosuccinate synthase
MPSKVVVGTQWGDEGKGKIIDILAAEADVVVRSQGGANAGHTVKSGKETYKLHLVPSGILYENTLNLIGAGVVLDPKSFLEELDSLRNRGVKAENLKIDPRAQIVMPWHKELDNLSEATRGDGKIGTTGLGIGPAYMDKYERSGIRMCDLLREDVLIEKIKANGTAKNEIIEKIYGGEPLDIEKITDDYIEYGKQLAKYVDDVSVITYSAYLSGKNILFEGAQACHLDIDFGTYPYVTSSHPITAGVCTGTGVGPSVIGNVIGVVKAYTTRVGLGPFPTELEDSTGEYIRERGAEYGTTTGRPRRCGWFDALIVKHAARVNGLTSIALNKVDTLGGLDTLKVCVAYKKQDGSVIYNFPPSIEELAECKPIYEELPGFPKDIDKCKTYAELPDTAKAYIEKIEELVGVSVEFVGVGPGRDQNLIK